MPVRRALLDIILSMDAEDVCALSVIWVERDREGGWQARCSIARHRYRTETTVPGGGLMSWERVPDQVYPLRLDEAERDRDLRAQAVALQSSGLCGKLEMARYDGADRSTSFLIKSHAGSQEERTRWLFGLRERPENTIWAEDGGGGMGFNG